MCNLIDTHLLFLEVFWRLLAYFTLTTIWYVQGLPSSVWILVTVYWDIRARLCGTKIWRLLSFPFSFLSSCFLSYVTVHKSCPEEMSPHKMVSTTPCKIITVLKLKAMYQIFKIGSYNVLASKPLNHLLHVLGGKYCCFSTCNDEMGLEPEAPQGTWWQQEHPPQQRDNCGAKEEGGWFCAPQGFRDQTTAGIFQTLRFHHLFMGNHPPTTDCSLMEFSNSWAHTNDRLKLTLFL